VVFDPTVRYITTQRPFHFRKPVGDPVSRPRRRGTPLASNPVQRAEQLRRRGLRLEYATLGSNVVGSILVLVAAVVARSVALAGFGLDSLIEIVASLVVVWQLQAVEAAGRERRPLRIIGVAFLLLAVYIAVQPTFVLVRGVRPHHSTIGIAWLALTAIAMFVLAAAKRSTGRALGNRVLETEARVTLIDGLLAVAVLAGLILNAWASNLNPTSLRRARYPEDAQLVPP
jgi:divalent metal cation (Fe/Co/Zn/Cd) transporter